MNNSVALIFPKLRARYGSSVTYADSPSTHILVEFSFDVVQAASGAYVSEAYQDFIGFQVSKPLLERAFAATYGLEMKDVFFSEDLTIGSYRRAISQTIPQVTRIAWRDKHDEIAKLVPGAAREKFVFNLSRKDYEQAYGVQYQKPGLLARFLALLYKLMPKVGPFRGMQFHAPTPEAEKLFLESFKNTRERYRVVLGVDAAIDPPNTDFDSSTARGEYQLADDLCRVAAPPVQQEGRGRDGAPARKHQRVLCGPGAHEPGPKGTPAHRAGAQGPHRAQRGADPDVFVMAGR